MKEPHEKVLLKKDWEKASKGDPKENPKGNPEEDQKMWPLRIKAVLFGGIVRGEF